MAFNKLMALVLLSAFVAVVVSEDEKLEDCSKKFKADTSKLNATEECETELKINPGDMPQTEEEFTKTYDDKCLGKCYMEKLSLVKDDQFNKDAIKKDVEEHVLDADLKEKILAYTMKCLDQVDEKLKSGGGKFSKENECTLPAEFLYCTTKHQDELDLKCQEEASE